MSHASVRGMPSILPSNSGYRRQVEHQLQQILAAFHYLEIRPPLIEKTALFTHSLGQSTQLVQKEMYSFPDRNDVSLSLRPEATAGIARTCLEHQLLTEQRLWHLGPMFRYERPQSGRTRQFDQLDVEIIGAADPAFDAELIWLGACFWQALELPNPPQLHINALGNTETRQEYNDALCSFLRNNKDQLDDESQARLANNPLRILDSKIPQTRKLLAAAPQLKDYWDDATRQHLNRTCELLETLGIEYQLNPLLVRGLDYYDKLVFEWLSSDLGAQDAVCAGGRYDQLIAQLGGKQVPASGFALGMERLFLLLEKVPQTSQLDLFLIGLCTTEDLLRLRQKLLAAIPHLSVEYSFASSSLKSQLKRADKKNARFALIIGEEELAQQSYLLRDMKQSSQTQLSWDELCHRLESLDNKNDYLPVK